MTELITIRSGQLSAQINPLGAELTHLQDADGRELMTDADPAYWTAHAPILFPVVGMPSGETIRIDGQEYAMPKHGFGRRSLFEIVSVEPDRVIFALTDSAATRAIYPFAFRLEIGFTVKDHTLDIDVTVINPAAQTLPASFGFHPAFAWPLPYGEDRDAHSITFSSVEADMIRRIAADATISPDLRQTPAKGRALLLDDAIFAEDALVWDNLKSDSLLFGADTGPQLMIKFPDTPMLALWTKMGAGYVCIEPWHGIADPQGYLGEFRDKPGIFEVPAFGKKRINMSVTLLHPG